MYLPGVGANHRRGGGMYLKQELSTGGEEVSSTWSKNHSYEGRGYLPGEGTKHMQMSGGGMHLEQDPIK